LLGFPINMRSPLAQAVNFESKLPNSRQLSSINKDFPKAHILSFFNDFMRKSCDLMNNMRLQSLK
jgi:hypothetical protein